MSSHGVKRMSDRGFSETDLRAMLESATGYRRDVVEGRWVIQAKHNRQPWEIIVEPDADASLLVFVTAYMVEN